MLLVVPKHKPRIWNGLSIFSVAVYLLLEKHLQATLLVCIFPNYYSTIRAGISKYFLTFDRVPLIVEYIKSEQYDTVDVTRKT